jgi:hypothetical protein
MRALVIGFERLRARGPDPRADTKLRRQYLIGSSSPNMSLRQTGSPRKTAG